MIALWRDILDTVGIKSKRFSRTENLGDGWTLTICDIQTLHEEYDKRVHILQDRKECKGFCDRVNKEIFASASGTQRELECTIGHEILHRAAAELKHDSGRGDGRGCTWLNLDDWLGR